MCHPGALSSFKAVAKRAFSLTLIVSCLVSVAAAQIKLTPGDVEDRRRSDGFFNRLSVKLKLNGPELAAAKAIRVLVATAVDDTGKNLINPKEEKAEFKDKSGFEETEATVEFELLNPERRAASIKSLAGTIEVYVPPNDPRAVLTFPGFQRSIGKSLSNPALKSAGVEVTVWDKRTFDAAKKTEEARIKAEFDQRAKKAQETGGLTDAASLLAEGLMRAFGSMFSSFAEMGENDVSFYVKDPEKKLIEIEIQDDKGKALERGGRMTIGGDPRTVIIEFKEKLPPTARLRLFLLTPKSIVKVPFSVQSIALP